MIAQKIIAAAMAHAYELPDRDALDRALSIPLLNMGIAELTSAENAYRSSYTPPIPELREPIFVARPEDDLPYDYHITTILLPLWLCWKVFEGMDDSRASYYRNLFEAKRAEIVPVVYDCGTLYGDVCGRPARASACGCGGYTHYNPAPNTTIVPPSLNDEPYPLDDENPEDPTDEDPVAIEPEDPPVSDPDEPTPEPVTPDPVTVVVQNDIIAGVIANYLNYAKVASGTNIRATASTSGTILRTLTEDEIRIYDKRVKGAETDASGNAIYWYKILSSGTYGASNAVWGYVYPEYAIAASGARSAGTKVARNAISRLGYPYELGARTDDSFDCSGLVYYSVRLVDSALASEKIFSNDSRPDMKRYAAMQAQFLAHKSNNLGSGKIIGEDIKTASDLAAVEEKCRPGDLVFWRKPGEHPEGRHENIVHTGVYVGKYRGPDEVLRSYVVEATTGSGYYKVIIRELWTKSSYWIRYIIRPDYNDSTAVGRDNTRAIDPSYSEAEALDYLEALEGQDE